MNSDLFWKLIEPEHIRARSFCRKLTGNRDDGDDLYQDSLVRGLTGFSGLRDRAVFRPWFYRIIINTYKNHVRKKKAREIQPLNTQFEDKSGANNPMVQYAARRRLEHAFGALSVNDRALVTLFELEGWKISELARIFGKSEGSIKVRLSRARVKMREALARFLVSPEPKKIVKILTGEKKICVAAKQGEN